MCIAFPCLSCIIAVEISGSKPSQALHYNFPMCLREEHCIACVLTITVAGRVLSSTATSVTLSWSVCCGSVVDSYEVAWQRDTSGECSDEDEGRAAITGHIDTYTITGLEENSTYIITVSVTNAAGSAVSHSVTGRTDVSGKYTKHC